MEGEVTRQYNRPKGGRKICPRCGINKRLDEYHKKKGGLTHSHCKECRVVESREYWLKNKKRLTAQAKTYRERPEYKEQRKKWDKIYEDKFGKDHILNNKLRYTQRQQMWLSKPYTCELLGVPDAPEEVLSLKRKQVLLRRKTRKEQPCRKARQ